MSQRTILEDRSYSFSEIFSLNIPTADLLPSLGYEFDRGFMPPIPEYVINVSDLEQEFREVLPYTDLNNEQARRETIVSSIVKFLVRKLKCRLSFEYSIKSDRLYGNVDYFLQTHLQMLAIEAKRDDLENGFNQLAAELIALDRSGIAPEKQAVLAGFVTTGTIWQIGLLDRSNKRITLSLNTYRVPEDLPVLMLILVQSLTIGFGGAA